MNVGDAIRNSNSWHWLCVVVVAAAAASVFLPTYGWRDVLQFAGRQLASDEARAQERLEETRALAAVDVAALAKETEKAKDALAEARAAFAKYGIEELPTDDKAVFSAQSSVGEALNRRRLRVISTEAKVSEKAAVHAAAKRTVPVAAPKKPLTADEFLAQSEKAATTMKDRKLADMVLSDARKKYAQMKEAEKKADVAAAKQDLRMSTSERTTSAATDERASSSLPFKTETLDYRVAGDFRDVFMFFVAETHQKPYYNFKDISASVGENGMDLAFTLQVNHR